MMDFEQVLIIIALTWAVSVTVFRGLVWPNDYAEAHWLITFQLSTLKRALIGTFVAPLLNINIIRPELIVGFFSGLFLLMFLIGLIWMCVTIISHTENKATAVLVSFAFLTSPYIVMSANLIGYYDNLIILLTLLTCWFIKKGHHLIGALILSISVFIHESVVLIGLPIALYFALLHYSQTTQTTSFTQLIINYLRHYWALIFLPTLAFLVLAGYQTFLFDEYVFTEEFRSALEVHSSFIKERSIREIPPMLATSYTSYLDNQIVLLQGRLTNSTHLTLMMPTIILIGFYALIALKRSPYRVQFWVLLLMCGAVPLSLHAIAFDSVRIWTYPLVVLMICLYSIHTVQIPSQRMKTQLPMVGIAMLVLMANINSHIKLMGQVVERFSQTERLIIYAPILSVLLLLSLFKLGQQRSQQVTKLIN